MSAGVQVFNEKGQLTLDLGTRTFNKLGTFVVQFGENQSITDDRVRDKRIAFFIDKIEIVKDGRMGCVMFPDHFIVEGNVIKWDFFASDTSTDWPSRHDTNIVSAYGMAIARVTYSYGWY